MHFRICGKIFSFLSTDIFAFGNCRVYSIMRLNRLAENYSVVLLGIFNPVLFHPFWLKDKGIITQQDIRVDINVKGFVVHQQLSSFPVGDWLDVIVKPDRAEFRIKDAAKLVLLKDLVIAVLNALPDTPILSFGINHGVISTLGNSKDYYEFGNYLNPLDIWGDTFKDPKLKFLSIVDDKPEGLFQKTLMIQPATFEGVQWCVDINMNYHSQMPDNAQKSLLAARRIAEHFESCLDDYDRVVKSLMDRLI